MARRLIFTFVLGISILLMGLVPTALAAPPAQTEQAVLMRLVHAVPDAPVVDVVIDGALAAAQLEYADYTSYLHLSSGDHAVTVQAGGTAIAEASFTLTPGQAITAIVMGPAASPEIRTFEDDLSPLILGNVRLNAIHAASGVDAVDLILPDGSPVLQGLAYGQSSGGIDIPANTYPLAVTLAGGTVDQAIRPPQDFHLRAGMLYRLVVLGGTPGTLLLEAPANPSGDSVFIRVAHAIPDTPTVDVYADETLIIPGLSSLEITKHFALPLDSYDVTVRISGSDSTVAPIIAASLDFSDAALAGQARTIAAVSRGVALDLAVYEDDFSDLDATTARLSVANAVTSANLIAELDDGTMVETAEAFASAPATDVPGGAYELLIASDGGGSYTVDRAFNGGVLYSFIVTGAADQLVVIAAEAALNQQPGSAVALAVAPPPPPPTVAPTPVAAVVEPTPAPTQAPPPAPTTPPQPAAAPVEGLLGLVFNLNPGTNLQLREYPRPNARSLGLAAGGTVLQVLGRAGEPDFENLPAIPSEDDLDPTQTWLKVIYNTPDGGTVTAWAIAQYVQVTEDGQRVRLLDLDPLPSNVPGQVSGPVAAPTAAPVASDFYAVVFNLSPGANLNIRRTPEVLGEVLARVPLGTILEPEGILEDRSWTFVTYRAADGGVITGWVATSYLQFVYRGTNYLPLDERITELLQRSLLRIAAPDRRGEVSAGAAPPAQAATADLSQFRNQYVGRTVLDPTSNLHLRRTPDAAAASLALIPNDAVMIVFGRTSDGNWLQVNYDNTEGWVASPWVEIQLNGQRVDLMDLPEVR